MEDGVEVEHARRAVGLESVTNLCLVQEIVGHKAVLDASHGDFIICSLSWGRADRIRTSGSHAVDFHRNVDVLSRFKRRKISVFADKANGLCVFGGASDLGYFEIENCRVKLIDDSLRSVFVKRKVFAHFFGNGDFVENILAVFHRADESFFYGFHITSSPSKFCLRSCCRTYSSGRNRKCSPSLTRNRDCR